MTMFSVIIRNRHKIEVEINNFKIIISKKRFGKMRVSILNQKEGEITNG